MTQIMTKYVSLHVPFHGWVEIILPSFYDSVPQDHISHELLDNDFVMITAPGIASCYDLHKGMFVDTENIVPVDDVFYAGRDI